MTTKDLVQGKKYKLQSSGKYCHQATTGHRKTYEEYGEGDEVYNNAIYLGFVDTSMGLRNVFISFPIIVYIMFDAEGELDYIKEEESTWEDRLPGEKWYDGIGLIPGIKDTEGTPEVFKKDEVKSFDALDEKQLFAPSGTGGISKEDKEKLESINPKYYRAKVQPIDLIEAQGLSFGRGNIIKYASRAGKKDSTKELEDLKKAQWYLEREIAKLEKTNLNNDLFPKVDYTSSTTMDSSMPTTPTPINTALFKDNTTSMNVRYDYVAGKLVPKDETF